MKKWPVLIFLIVIIVNGCAGTNGRKWLSFFIDGVPAEEELRKEKEKSHSSSEDIADIVKKMKQKEEEKWQSRWEERGINTFTREEIEQEFLDAGINLEIFAVSPFSEDSHLAHVVGRTA